MQFRAEDFTYNLVVRPGQIVAVYLDTGGVWRAGFGCALEQGRFDLRAGIAPSTKIMQRIQHALDKPNLIWLRIKGPSAAEHDELDLISRVAGGVIGLQTRVGLQIGVEMILLSALGAWFISQVAFWHAHVIRAKDAFARAGIGLGEHGDRRYTRAGAHRLAAQAQDDALIVRRQALVASEGTVGFDQLIATEDASAAARMLAQETIKLWSRQAIASGDDAQDGQQRFAVSG